ncbi:hypothetical protein [Prauserella shujinwangii]|nr:hypothetical protein [Prauserella shujinwangii]
MRQRLFRSVAALGVAAAVVAAIALPASAATPPPAFDFADCPALPEGADPARWRCEVLVSTGTLSFGHVRDLRLAPMRLTFAEGTLEGRYAQVFGALRAGPTTLPGLPGGTLRLAYGGYSDFEANADRKGEIALTAELAGRLLPGDCAIGTAREPIHSEIQQVGPTEVVSVDPPVLRFRSIDEQLAMPATTGCGGWGRVLDRRLGLPSESGRNTLEQDTLVALRPYG